MINVLLASRGRPQAAREMWDGALLACSDPLKIQLSLRLDEDDEQLSMYDLPTQTTIGKRIGAPSSFAELAKTYGGDILLVAADDVRFRTKNWDVKLRQAFGLANGKPLAIFTNDGAGRRTHPAVNSAWMKLTGNLWCPRLAHFYADTWIEEISKTANCYHYAEDIMLEHMHAKYGKGIWDKTYQEERTPEKQAIDSKVWNETKEERLEWVKRLSSPVV